MSELLRLAQRCEQATGPDANLDEAIEKSLPCSRRFAENNPHAPKTQWNERGAQFHGAWIGEYDDFEEYKSPRYTASLDAAMTLVPEGWSMSFGEQRGWPVGKQMFAWLADRNTPDGIAERHVEGRAATPALALCAAALRARAATPIQHPGDRTVTKDSGADPALAKAEPVARLGPSGFDPGEGR